MKKFFAVMMLACALVVAGTLSNQALATTGAVWDAVVDYDIDFLALRSGPSTSYPEILRIPPGAHIQVFTRGALYRQNKNSYNFLSVRYRGVDGYACERYFTMYNGREMP